jgi:hypothetical protein
MKKLCVVAIMSDGRRESLVEAVASAALLNQPVVVYFTRKLDALPDYTRTFIDRVSAQKYAGYNDVTIIYSVNPTADNSYIKNYAAERNLMAANIMVIYPDAEYIIPLDDDDRFSGDLSALDNAESVSSPVYLCCYRAGSDGDSYTLNLGCMYDPRQIFYIYDIYEKLAYIGADTAISDDFPVLGSLEIHVNQENKIFGSDDSYRRYLSILEDMPVSNHRSRGMVECNILLSNNFELGDAGYKDCIARAEMAHLEIDRLTYSDISIAIAHIFVDYSGGIPMRAGDLLLASLAIAPNDSTIVYATASNIAKTGQFRLAYRVLSMMPISLVPHLYLEFMLVCVLRSGYPADAVLSEIMLRRTAADDTADWFRIDAILENYAGLDD